MYEIKQITEPAEILSCTRFDINHFNWNSNYQPVSYGYAGLLKDKGLLVHLCCEENNPLCTYTEPNSMVYKDSALEAFFQLNPEHNNGYINLELNSAGVLRAQFGETRDEREFFTSEQMEKCVIEHGRNQDVQNQNIQNHDYWWVQILLPFSVMEDFYGKIDLTEGTRLRCNFFKLAEAAEIEHYASYSPIEHPVPNFHLPEFFAEAVIC